MAGVFKCLVVLSIRVFLSRDSFKIWLNQDQFYYEHFLYRYPYHSLIYFLVIFEYGIEEHFRFDWKR